MYPLENETSLLEIELELSKQPAGKGRRVINYLIDTIVYIASWYVLMVAILLIWNFSKAPMDYNSSDFTILIGLSPFILYVPFYIFCEFVFRGGSVGKFFTKTKTIRLDGNRFTMKDALLRSLIRLIPIEPFSAFSNSGPWHDRWTKTRVVTK